MKKQAYISAHHCDLLGAVTF